ncbi:hypothetical protein K7432_014095 [Basidiobolus ranarum]|uniref:Uncharacterized protein n=1 Tax=Basidiobolus ranarum TaxID=34480 RepID=A0ABR2VPX1_9FUNG
MRCLYSLIALVASIQLVQGSYGDDNGSDNGGDNYEAPQVCNAPSSQAPFNNKAFSSNEKTDPANFDSVVRGPGYTAASLLKAGWGPNKMVHVNGYKFILPKWGKGMKDNWIEGGQKVKVTSVPGATRLGFLLSSDMGNFGGKFHIVYTDCTTQVERVGATDWKWKIEHAPGNTIARNGFWATNGGDVRIYTTEVDIDPSKTIAYVQFPMANEIYDIHPYSKGTKGHVHVFALATKKVGY